MATQFAAYLNAWGCSPNTARAYGHDLSHLHSFLTEQDLDWRALTPARAVDLLIYLRGKPSRRRGAAQHPSLAASDGEPSFVHLSPATINRVLAAVSSFYEWARISERFDGPNPIARVADRSMARVTDRHVPFLAGISRHQPSRRTLRVKTVHRLPRPLEAEQVEKVLASLRCRRDLALIRLMLDGGLRPGEVLGLHLGDISYGRRRVTVRYREDHPRGVRQKSRTDRVVDLHEATTLAAVSSYILDERPAEAETALVFLVGGKGRRRCEPLSYAALVRLFARVCTRAGIRTPWTTPHCLRHTHATRMWEGGIVSPCVV